MVESELELLVTRDSSESPDCTCDAQWPEANDGACPQHGLDTILVPDLYESERTR